MVVIGIVLAVAIMVALVFGKGNKQILDDKFDSDGWCLCFLNRERRHKFLCAHGVAKCGRPWTCEQCVGEWREEIKSWPEPELGERFDRRYSAPGPFHAPWCQDIHTGNCLTEQVYKNRGL